MVYYGLSLNTSNLGGDPYVNFAIAGAVEIPANLLCMLILQFFGRRIPLCVSLVLAGVSLLLTLAVPTRMFFFIVIIILS